MLEESQVCFGFIQMSQKWRFRPPKGQQHSLPSVLYVIQVNGICNTSWLPGTLPREWDYNKSCIHAELNQVELTNSCSCRALTVRGTTVFFVSSALGTGADLKKVLVKLGIWCHRIIYFKAEIPVVILQNQLKLTTNWQVLVLHPKLSSSGVGSSMLWAEAADHPKQQHFVSI